MDEETPGGEEDQDEAAAGADEFHTALPPKMEAWRKRSATGAILTGLALGLQDALEKEREEPSIVMQTSGDPPTDLPVEADFEYRRPRHSVVNIRPWLVEPTSTAKSEDGPDGDPGVGEDVEQPDPDQP